MINKLKLIFLILLNLIVLSGCESMNYMYSSKFSPENVIKLKQGMTDKEIISIFGLPQKTKASTCGQALGKPWTCIMWYYGDWRPCLTFQASDDGKLYLNSWDI